MQGHVFMWSWWLLVLTSLSVALIKAAGTSQNWKYAGCFADPVSQALIPTDQVSNSIVHRNMTVERCIDFCENKRYTIAALEMTSNCFCANEFAAPLINSTQCNTPCGGDYEQMCGGTGSVSVYTNGFALVNSSASPNVSQVQATSLWTRYHDHGCFSQASSVTNASARQTYPFKITSNNMTQEECQNQCAANSFKIANLHNGTECQCARCFVFKLRRSNNCESPCSGNSKQNCGGVRSMLIFVKGGTNPRGCAAGSTRSTKTSPTQLNGASLFGLSQSAIINVTSATNSTFTVSNATTLTANATSANILRSNETTTASIYPMFLSNISFSPIIRVDNENSSTIVSLKNSSFSDGSGKLGTGDSTTSGSLAGSTTSMTLNSTSSTITPVNTSATFIRVLFPNDVNQLLQNASTTNYSSSSTTTTSASSTRGPEASSTSTGSSTSTAITPTVPVFLNTTSASSSNIIVSVSAGNATSTTSTPLPSAAENLSKGVPNNNATSSLPSSTSTSSTSSTASSTNSTTASATESISTTSTSSTSSEVSPSLSTTPTPLNMANVVNNSATSTSSTTSPPTSIVAQTPLMPMLGTFQKSATSSTTSEIDRKTESTTFSALAANSIISENSTTTTTTLGQPSSSTAGLGIIIQMPSTTTASDTPTLTSSVAISSTTSATTTTSSA